MSLLIYSPQCNHSLDIINYIQKHENLKKIVSYHNINKLGVPPQFKNKIKNWLESLLPVKELEMVGFGSCSMTTLDGEGTNEMFGLDDYGTSLQPPMTAELEEKINRSVNDAYNSQSKQD